MELVICLAIAAFVVLKVLKAKQEASLHQSTNELLSHSLGLMMEQRTKMEAQGIPFIPRDLPQGVSQMVDFPYKSFDEWNEVYRQAAFEANPVIRPNLSESGKMVSIIDFLDNTPVIMAYKHHLDPRPLGRRFGETFDLNEITLPDGTKTGEVVQEVLGEHGITVGAKK